MLGALFVLESELGFNGIAIKIEIEPISNYVSQMSNAKRKRRGMHCSLASFALEHVTPTSATRLLRLDGWWNRRHRVLLSPPGASVSVLCRRLPIQTSPLRRRRRMKFVR